MFVLCVGKREYRESKVEYASMISYKILRVKNEKPSREEKG